MVHRLLSNDSWSEDCPRAKHQVNDKIVYYNGLKSADAPGALQHELAMMEAATKAGVPSGRVFAYNRYGELEVAVLEFVEGVPLDELAKTEPAKADEIVAKVREALSKLATATNPTPVLPLDHWMSERGKAFSGAQALYRYLLHCVTRAPNIRPAWNIQSFELKEDALASWVADEPCVLVHGDTAENNNVIVKPDGTFVLIDWEIAGYYPRSVAHYLSGTAPPGDKLCEAVAALCQAQKAFCFGEQDKFEVALPRLLSALEVLEDLK